MEMITVFIADKDNKRYALRQYPRATVLQDSIALQREGYIATFTSTREDDPVRLAMIVAEYEAEGYKLTN